MARSITIRHAYLKEGEILQNLLVANFHHTSFDYTSSQTPSIFSLPDTPFTYNMSSGNSDPYDHASKTEANGVSTVQLERLQTAGGHPDDRTQPSLPVVHRRFANPAPLGLLSFATGTILLSFSIMDVCY